MTPNSPDAAPFKPSIMKGLSFQGGHLTLVEWNGENLRLKVLFPVGPFSSQIAHHAEILFKNVSRLAFPLQIPSHTIYEVTFRNENQGRWIVEFSFEKHGQASIIECEVVDLIGFDDEGAWNSKTISHACNVVITK